MCEQHALVSEEPVAQMVPVERPSGAQNQVQHVGAVETLAFHQKRLAPDQLLRRDDGVDVIDHLGGAIVPVSDGIGQQLAGSVEEAVVHAPHVDADRRGIGDAGYAGQDFAVEATEVPAEVTVPLDDPVGEAMDGLDAHVVAVDDPGHDAPPRRTDVDGGEDGH